MRASRLHHASAGHGVTPRASRACGASGSGSTGAASRVSAGAPVPPALVARLTAHALTDGDAATALCVLHLRELQPAGAFHHHATACLESIDTLLANYRRTIAGLHAEGEPTPASVLAYARHLATVLGIAVDMIAHVDAVALAAQAVRTRETVRQGETIAAGVSR